MIRRGRDPRTWPAASATGDLSVSSKHQGCPGEPWWHTPVTYLALAVALAIATFPIAFVGWVVVETCT